MPIAFSSFRIASRRARVASLIAAAALLPAAACAQGAGHQHQGHEGHGAAAASAGTAPAAATAAVAAPATGPGASAIIASAANPAAKGAAKIVPVDGGLKLSVHVEGMDPGEKGIHIHMTGKCDAPDYASAGGHWNPTQRSHGFENPKGQHMGDLPNLLVNAAGTGDIDYIIKGGVLSGAPAALLDADGAAIVIHAARDDMKSDPAGNSGGRIACGVFSAG